MYVVVSKACLSNMTQENPKERLSKDAALFDATADFEWLRRAAIELHGALRVRVERLDHAL